MNFNNLKRNIFFWVEKLQISRKERIAFSLLLAILAVLFSVSLILQRTFQYDQEEYDQIVAEFEKRSAVLEQKDAELTERYIPDTESATEQAASLGPADPVPATENKADENSSEPIPQKPININTASSAELQTLDGIGPAYAQNIIDYREANGGFNSIDELINVKGIGEKRLANIRPFITLNE